jgi:hypothetical protein
VLVPIARRVALDELCSKDALKDAIRKLSVKYARVACEIVGIVIQFP